MKKQQKANGNQQNISRFTHHASRFIFYTLSALLLIYILPSADAQKISVGSKRFTESYVLGEIAKRLLEDAGYRVEHKQGMGGTIIVWGALQNGDIAMYPDYRHNPRDDSEIGNSLNIRADAECTRRIRYQHDG